MEDEKTVVMKAEDVRFESRRTQRDYEPVIDIGVFVLMLALGVWSASRFTIEVLGSLTWLAVVGLGIISLPKEMHAELFPKLYRWMAVFFLAAWITYLLHH